MFRVVLGEFELSVDAETAMSIQTDTQYASDYLNMLRRQFPDEEIAITDGSLSLDNLGGIKETIDVNAPGPSGIQALADAPDIGASNFGKNNNKNFKWSHKTIMLIFDLYRDFKEIFKNGNYKIAWQKIASEMVIQGYHVTWQQCQVKMDTLKRRYKNIKDGEKRTGTSPITWEYYSIMDELFGEKKWAKPLEGALSSTSGMTSSEMEIEKSVKDDDPKPGCSKITPKRKIEEKILGLIDDFHEDTKKKREEKKRGIEEKEERRVEMEARREERHREKMEQRKELINLLKNHLKGDKTSE